MKQPLYFSDELEALIGEWLAYSSIAYYYENTLHEFYPKSEIKAMTHKALFEDIFFHTEHDPNLTNTARLFNQVGISFSGADGTVCKYEDIGKTIRQNIAKLQRSFFDFFGAANTKSERDFFKIEPGCKPLFKQFIAEGYCTYLNNRFFWTSKIRTILEVLGYWESLTHPTKDEKILASLSPSLVKQLNYLAATNQLIMAVKTLQDSKGLDLRTAKFFLEEFMFPETWGKQQEPTRIRWYGPNTD